MVSTLYGLAGSDDERTDGFIHRFHMAAYGRGASEAELQQWRGALNAAAAQGAEAVQAAAESKGRQLFAAQVSDLSLPAQQLVTNLYEGFLQRGPDSGGLSWWTGEAGSTVASRQHVLDAFAVCDPFKELAGALYRETFWLVGDQLGTPRMVADRSGSLAGVKRHDYLPFGEELIAGAGGRATTQGYVGNADGNRKRWAQLERDGETGLDYAQARYYSNTQGRFTSVDPENYQAMLDITDPQSWNAYAYVNNNPLRRNDPGGRGFWEKLWNGLNGRGFVSTETYLAREEQRQRQWLLEQERKDGTLFWRANANVPWTRLDIESLSRDQVKFFYCEFQKTPTDLTQEEMKQAVDQFPDLFPQFAAPTGSGNEPWRSTNASRPLNKMGHASKHLGEFQKIDSSLTDTDVAKILEHVRSVGTSTATQHGGKAFEAVVNIGGKSVTVKVIESAGGVIKTGFPVP